MPKIEEKQLVVKEIEAKLKASSLVVFTDYKGLNVAEINELRAKLKAIGSDYVVVKNTLTRLALKDAGMEDLDALTVGPNAVLFAMQEPVEAAKILFDFAKAHKALEVKGGALEGKAVDAPGIRELSLLPPREVLIARVLGGLQAPLYGFAYVLQANLTGLVRALDQVREQKAS